MTLTKDIHRCHNENCPAKQSCARWVQRHTVERSALFDWSEEQGGCDYFIKAGHRQRKRALRNERVDYATNKLLENGFEPTYEDGKKIHFLFKGSTVVFWPYTGWFSGKTVKDGRGLSNLLKQITK